MIINWGALALVAVVTVVAAVSIVGLFALGVVALTSTQRSQGGAPALIATVSGYACLGVSLLIAAYGLYLIIPQFH
jgi:hypothetical protein